MIKSNSYCNGPVPLSAYNGNCPLRVRHDWHCACRWCVQGHK